MWCSSSDKSREGGIPQPHHRIVRIPPGESVVLNSAERAPYLLLIEILNDDLDFNPNKRSNKEVLKKIAVKEDERKGASGDLISFNTSTARRHIPHSSSVNDTDVAQVMQRENSTKSSIAVIPATPSAASPVQDDEEIDVVEQLYGDDLRSPQVDLSESIVLPLAPKNKELDLVAWSRAPSVPPSPSLENGHYTPRLSSSIDSTPSSIYSSPRLQEHAADTPTLSAREPRSLTLDDYSDRMRTAAIMLAQLNANLVREPVTNISGMGIPSGAPPQTRPLNWIPGSNWLTNNSESSSSRSPTHPSLIGAQPDMSTRMRLQYSEASAIRDRIMKEMISLEEERMERMRENREGEGMIQFGDLSGSHKSAEDEGIIRRELNKQDPSAVLFSESWAAKKVSPH